MIARAVGTKTKTQIKDRIHTLRNQFKKEKRVPEELSSLQVNQKRNCWSKEEEKALIDAIRDYGKNHSLIAQLFENKSKQDVLKQT